MNYFYAQTLCYLEYFKKSLHFYKFCVYILYIMLIAGSPCCQLKKANVPSAASCF